METAAIGIHAPSKRQIRTVVPAQNLLGVVFKELELDARAAASRPSRCVDSNGLGGLEMSFITGIVPP